MTALLLSVSTGDILYWAFKKNYAILSKISYFVYSASFNSIHWLFACRYWKVSILMPYIIGDKDLILDKP